MNKYLPELKPKVANIHWPLKTKIDVVEKLTGSVIKIIYAFLYQEKYLKVPGFDTKIMIELGGAGISMMNGFADSLTGFPQTDGNVNRSFGVYPGEEKCKYEQAHSTWHEVSANGLLDIVFLCDYIHGLSKEYYYIDDSQAFGSIFWW